VQKIQRYYRIWREYYRFASSLTLIMCAFGTLHGLLTGRPFEALILLMLAAFEINVSFDNAAVNATCVKQLSEQWQQYFLRWGILIATFGMRLAVPIAAVSIGGRINPVKAASLAVTDQHQYGAYLALAQRPVMVFGGVFLLQIFTSFIFDADAKNGVAWFVRLESRLERVGERFNPVRLAFVAALVAVVVTATVRSDHLVAGISGACGIALYTPIGWLSSKLNKPAGRRDLVGREALMVFLYLELQDAMFSFDSAFGGFGYTLDVVLLTLGLGVGAAYVRSMTIYMVKEDTLSKLPYLGHGAYAAIGVLSLSMLSGVSDLWSGGASMLLIAMAVLRSLYTNRRKEPAPAAAP